MTRSEILKAIAEADDYTDLDAQMELYKEIVASMTPHLLGYLLQVARTSGRQLALGQVLRHADREEKFCGAVIDSIVRLSED